MRITTLLLLSLLCITTAFAQSGTITGKLVDEKGGPLRFANVGLFKTTKGSAPTAGAISDSLGRYTLATPAAGTYLLQFTAIGFAKQSTDSFAIAGNNFSKDFGTITLKSEAKDLQNINITALRPTIVQLADRMVVSVEGTAMAAGNSAYTVLGKSPGIFIDQDGNIQLNGRGVTVMIDGRLTYMSAKDLRNLLESMPAENIKSIELIHNPSSRFDAEGSGGIINIVLRKNTVQGINGSVNASYTYNWKQHAYSTGLTLNVKTGKWNSFLFSDLTRRVGGREATFTRVFYSPNKTTYFDQVATGNFTVQGPPSVRVGTDYDITDKHSVGGMFAFNTNTAHADFLTDTYIGNAPGKPYQYIDADNLSSNTWKSITSNVHYVAKIDTLGSTFSTDADYAHITNRGDGNFYNTFLNITSNETTTDNLYTFTPNGYKIYSGKMDWVKQFTKETKIEAGVKGSHVVSDNDSRFYFNNNDLVLDPLRTNHFYYEEDILAGYVNYATPFSRKLSFQAGLRAENTTSTGNSLTTGQVTKRSYLDFFPTLFLQQKVNDNWGINWSYARRLNRPNYGTLNPFRAYRDPYTWTVGNPYLRPSYQHSITVAQTFRKQYILQFYYHHTKDVMTELPSLDVATATTTYTTGNVDKGTQVGTTAIIPFKILKFWDTRNTAQLMYSKFTTVSNFGPIENKQLFWLGQSIHTLLLPKDFRLELSFLFRGPNASGLYHMDAMNWIDVGLKKSFFNKKLDMTVTAADIFKGYRYYWTTNIGGNINEFDQYFRFNTIGFTLRYNFSKGQKTNTKQRTGPEEVNRAQ